MGESGNGRGAMKILVLTVGGQCAPIVTSINQNTPDEVYFICSYDLDTVKGSYNTVVGDGKVCGKDPKNPDEVNILKQTGLIKDKEWEKDHMHKIKNFDDLNECYIKSLSLLKNIKDKNPGAEIIIDYTGGTKSMSVGLGAAAMEISGITVCLVKGTRTDLIKVQNGTQRIRLTQMNMGFLKRQVEIAEKLMDRYDYDGAISILEDTAKLPNIPDEIDAQIGKYLSISKAYLAWDRFDHIEAWRLLHNYRRRCVKNVMFLEAVIWSHKKFDEDFDKTAIEGLSLSQKGCGYELVEDIVLNAERRAKQGRYDDATGRLYRALELLIQLRLQLEYSILTGNIDVEKLPDVYKNEYEAKRDTEDNKIKIGLKESYELLVKKNHEDTLAKIYTEKEKYLWNSLNVRNNSLYAHGLTPILKEQYEEFHKIFVNDILEIFLLNFGSKHIQRYQFNINNSNNPQ
ncbi:MAG: TIGR02710 family CRISPR-associated CARF protein [Nitrospirota bacterium]|nr:TIGR02710 family CRISPR-associated CARF protein [Nitrospirota bacterium]